MRILLAWVSAMLLAGPAAAQVNSPAPMQSLVLDGHELELSPGEQRAIIDLARSRAMSPAYQDRALAAAERAVRTNDARYAFALYQLEIAGLRQDDAMRVRALETLIANSATPPAKLAGYLETRGGAAFRTGNFATAAADWARVVDLQPGNPQALMNLAQARQRLNDPAGAADLIHRAIAAHQGGTAPILEAWYRQWLSIAFNGRLQGEIFPAAHGLVTAYPSAENWRTALGVYRDVSAPGEGAEVALLRLMRAAGAFSRSAEYQRLAQLLLRIEGAAEARQVLEDGIGRGLVSRTEAPVPDILSEIDRAAAPRSAPDPASQALREAAALAASGRAQDAQAAFQRVADGGAGRHAEIARFWLTWLAARGGSTR